MAVSGMPDTTAQTGGFTDARINATGFRTSTMPTEDDNYGNINDLDTRLSAIDATTYTVAMLRTMSKNDKVYALRLKTADAAGIK